MRRNTRGGESIQAGLGFSRARTGPSACIAVPTKSSRAGWRSRRVAASQAIPLRVAATIIPVKLSVAGVRHMVTAQIAGRAVSAAIIALTRYIRIIAGQLKERDVIVAMYCPGYVKTRMDTYGYATVEISESIALLRPMIADLTIENTGSYTGHDGRTIGW